MRPRRRPLAAIVVVAALATAGMVAGCGADDAGERPDRASGTAAPPAAATDAGPRWPGAGWRPYADSSPFNRRVTAADQVHPDSAAIVARILSWGMPAEITAGTADATDYTHPVLFAQEGDPAIRLEANQRWGPSPIDGAWIRVPRGARAARGTDGHLAIVQPDGWEYDLWQAGDVPEEGGTLPFSWGGRLRIDGDGIGGGATAADFGLLAGVLRPEELAAGEVRHALFVVVRCTSDLLDFGAGVQPHPPDDLGSSYVAPARKGGDRCPEGEAGAPPMGARLRLEMTDAEIAALRLPRWKRAIATALARYGAYVGDTGGPGFAVMTMSGASYTALGAQDPWVALAREAGVPARADGTYGFDLASGIDWAGRLRVLLPPAAGIARKAPDRH